MEVPPAFSITSDITAKQLDEVVMFVPSIIDWLRMTTPQSVPKQLITSAQESRFNSNSVLVGFALQTLLQVKQGFDDGISRDMSAPEIQRVFDSYDNRVWVGAVLHIFEFAETPVITPQVKLALLRTVVHNPSELDKLKKTLKSNLEALAHTALGELCALIMQTCPNKRQIAEILGPYLLLDNTVTDRKARSAASTIFRTIVENCYTLFDIPENSVQVTMSRRHTQTRTRFHAQQYLRLFFELRDRKYLPIVDSLFQYHGFVDIARGIFCKYFMLPEGWRSELISKQKSGVKMNWFKPKKIFFLNEETVRYPSASKLPFYYKPETEHTSEAEHVVDEIVTSEKSYFDYLRTFVTSYANEVTSIASGSIGDEAAIALGLTVTQVDLMFGKRLNKIIETIDKILVKLEVLVLVREPIPSVYNIDRAGVLADIMTEVSTELGEAYKPYNKYYAQSAGMLTTAITHTAIREPKARKGSKQIADHIFDDYKRHLTFLELWQEISNSKPLLKGLRIDAILIKPVHRFPKYLLFFERLEKVVRKEHGVEHPTYLKVSKAQKALKEVTSKINDDINRYNDMQRKKFGEVVDGAALMRYTKPV